MAKVVVVVMEVLGRDRTAHARPGALYIQYKPGARL